MKSFLRSLSRVLTIGAVGLAASVVAPSAASAAYTPEGVCGSGYTRLSSVNLYTRVGEHWGYSYVLYSGATRKNCAVTIKRIYLGTATKTTAWLMDENGETDENTGDFKYYAGPVYVTAPGQCVSYGGFVWDPSGNVYAYGARRDVHCG